MMWLFGAAVLAIIAGVFVSSKPSPLENAAGRRKARQSFQKDNSYYAKRGVKSSEELLRNSRGIEIFTKLWLPVDGELKGLVFYCHGYGDTCVYFFDDVAVQLAACQYGVASMDYEGHGQSSGLHVYIKDFDAIITDVIEQASNVKRREEFQGLPCFLYGESMGGAVALQVHRRQPEAWDGAILLAPMCKIADNMIPPSIVVATLKLLAKLLPRWKAVPTKDICEIAFRVPEKRQLGSANPTAYSGKPRLGTAVSLLDVTDTIGAHLHEVSLPLLILHGAADIVTDASVSRALYEQAMSKDKTFHLYPDAWHALIAGEPDDVVNKVMADMLTWLDKHSKPISIVGKSEFWERTLAAEDDASSTIESQ